MTSRTRKLVVADVPHVEENNENIEPEDHPMEDDDGSDFASSPRKTSRNRNKRGSNTDAHKGNATFSKDAGHTAQSDTFAQNSRRASHTGRTSVRAGRRSLLDRLSEEPTIDAPSSVKALAAESSTTPSTPLGDITANALNMDTSMKQAMPVVAEKTKTSALPVSLEKPMDIVIRTRTNAMPTVPENNEPKPRLVITYLILTNFKSYAGKQEVGPFHASFSSVVGPNGSGKSNVIDSLLFVFGFRASKMRQGKISSLIHNSAQYPNLDFCEVQVHFRQVIDQSTGSSEVVPDSDLIVSRKAFKNNTSKYFVNGSESNFTAVTTMLRDHGIDLDHKRFLILQGEVESIAQMKPKAANEHDDGLLEYLEDIIGTSKYKTPIEESAAETETLNEVCREKSARVQHVEKEKSALETKKNAALAYVNNENELAIKQSALWQIFVHECEDNIQVTQEATAQVQSNLDAKVSTYQGNENDMTALSKQYDSETKELEKLQKAAQALAKDLAKADKESVKLEEKKKHLASRQSKLEKSKVSNRSALSESTAYLQRLEEDLERNTSAVDALAKEVATEEATLASIREGLKGKTQELSEEISKKQKLLEPWLEQISEKQSAISVAQSELQMLLDQDASGSQALTNTQEKLNQLQTEKASKIKNLEQCQSRKNDLESQVVQLQTLLEKMSQQEQSHKTKVSSARQKVDEARASLSKSQAQGNVLAGLNRLKDTGRISGFHGRLGNLGAIDSKYDVAISTACPSLDNLVVDSVDVGEKCIDFLRKNALGRANFILLDRLGARDLGTIETPENVPRLFDLVKSKDERFRPAFYSVLQNTLVAKDLDQANRIAFGAKRWRVVTLDGQLIDKSGTMSGGGVRTAKGAMSSKIVQETTSEQVASLEKDLASEDGELHNIHERVKETRDRLDENQAKIPMVATEIQKIGLEIESLQKAIKDAESRRKELQSRSRADERSDQARKSDLERTVSTAEKEINNLKEQTAGIEADIAALQERIMEIGGVKLRQQKAKVDGLKQEIATLTEEISGEEVAKAKTEKAKAKQEKNATGIEAEMVAVQADIAKLEDEAQSQTRDLSTSRGEVEAAQEAVEAKKEEITALKEQVDERTKELNEMRGAEIELRNQLEENQKILSENMKRLKYWEEKLNKLRIQNVSAADAMIEEQEVPQQPRDELADLSKDTLKGEIAVLEERTQNADVDMTVLADYRRRVEEHASRNQDLSEAIKLRDSANHRCEELRRLRLEGFMEGFSTISLRLKEMYQMITMGGNAELELVDSLDPFSEGILFSVMPPKKSWKNISNLSGGEKTLSSLALVFALHHYKPTPLYVMDEIDAALDFRNVSIVASYIKERTKNAQFIVISLRNNMFELASRLVGVYKVNHMTKSVTVENRDYIRRA